MDDWKYTPAHDLGLSEGDRLRSVQREPGLAGFVSRHVWWGILRAYFAVGQRVTIVGREHLPEKLPFMIVANHASHFDALLLALALPLQLRNHVFPIAAGDTFFETPMISAFAAGMMNALPMWRKNAGRHAMEELRRRLVEEPCGYVLFPEGTRTRTGEMAVFRAGVGMLIAGAAVPIVPCHLAGTFEALPAGRRFPRRAGITVRIGPALSFAGVGNTREGWVEIAARLEGAVRGLGEG
jgi:1-acyl-sn-glycerol-3-phosphate acyltransferase